MDTLQRFLDAQAPVYATVCAELRAGCKQSHWMWFIFPQLRGLGHSAMAQRYGIADRAEALAYARHPVLGQRLRDCLGLLLAHRGRSAQALLGEVDALKLRSCATLFAAVDPQQPLYAQVLRQFYGGQPDARTLQLLAQQP
ncbi:MAG: DUF1810 domain-containing protein [Chloroflexaceae bacterium]|nr:DUF1810 domain-containing protein [Chloroflexaceae bacterium]